MVEKREGTVTEKRHGIQRHFYNDVKASNKLNVDRKQSVKGWLGDAGEEMQHRAQMQY